MGKLKRLMNPPFFQGNLREKNYFEGWYLKNVSKDLNSAISFIPGISLSQNSHSFIQIIDGINGWTHYFEFPTEDFKPAVNRFEVRIGRNTFSMKGLIVDLNDRDIRVKGKIEFSGITPFPKRFLSPGIMGWYTFVPRMECYHGVVSMNHSLSGNIEINGTRSDFHGGKGYIEKDWGRSFPESWIWLQCNNFDQDNVSFMLSIAKIPWFGRNFTGFLSFIKIGERIYRFATYTGAKVTKIKNDPGELNIKVRDRKLELSITAIQKGSGELAAPIFGNMDRRIKESVDSDIHLVMTNKKGNVLFSSNGSRAGLEVMGDIESLK
jgi:hypothetical protein